jgi:DUF2075 family protein
LLESEINKKNNIQLKKRTESTQVNLSNSQPWFGRLTGKKRTESTQNNPTERKLKKLWILISHQINIEWWNKKNKKSDLKKWPGSTQFNMLNSWLESWDWDKFIEKN